MTQTKITRKQQIQIFLHPSKKLAYVAQAKLPLTQDIFNRLPLPDIWHNGISSQPSDMLVVFEEFLTEEELSNNFDFFNEWFELPDGIDFEGTIKQLATLNIPEYMNVFYPELLRSEIAKNAMFSILHYISTLIKQKHSNKFKYD
jgi:hypothetical protein